MKGIVVEISDKNAVILSDEGLFTKIKNNNYQIGQPIKIEENKKIVPRWIAGAASMAAVMAFCTIGAFAYYTPTDYVSMDVNPSIEYSVNRFDRILDVKAMNDDGKAILSELDLKNKTIQNGVKETLDQLVDGGYLAEDSDAGVVITASNEDMTEAEELATELKQEINTYLNKKDGIAAEVDAEAVGLDRVAEAKELGVTPGKLNLVEKLQESTSGAISREEWLAMPVKEINKAIKENRRLEKEKGKENTEDKLDGTGAADEEDIVSEGGTKWKSDDSKPEKSNLKEPGSWKDNRGNSKDDRNGFRKSNQEEERVLNEDGDHGADGIKNKTGSAGDEDWLKKENLNESGSQHDDINRPDNGKSPNGGQ